MPEAKRSSSSQKHYNTTSGNLSDWLKKSGIKKPGTWESRGGIGTHVRLGPLSEKAVLVLAHRTSG